MWELMLKLESIRLALREKLLPNIGSNDYHIIGAVIALIMASGTLVTGLIGAPIAVPAGGIALVSFLITGVLGILTIVLLPVGFVLL